MNNIGAKINIYQASLLFSMLINQQQRHLFVIFNLESIKEVGAYKSINSFTPI